MLLWTKLRESLVEEVLLSQLVGFNHQTLSCLISIVMISMCPQHLVYSRWQPHAVNVPILLLLWLRTPVMCPRVLPSPSPSQPETSVGRMVPLLMHPIPTLKVSFGMYSDFHSGIEIAARVQWHCMLTSFIWRIRSKAFSAAFDAYRGCVVVVNLCANILHGHL